MTSPTYYFYIQRDADGLLRIASGKASSHLTHDRLFTYEEVSRLQDIVDRYKGIDMHCDDIRVLCVKALDGEKK